METLKIQILSLQPWNYYKSSMHQPQTCHLCLVNCEVGCGKILRETFNAIKFYRYIIHCYT